MQSEAYHADITAFAEVILPLPLRKNYTYGIPKELEESVAIGKRVEIQFGQRKIYAGIVSRIHHDAPREYKIKPILSVLDDSPILFEVQLTFWKWLADYYLCSEGDVMNAALPAGFKLESETRIVLHPDFKDDFSKLDDKEYLIAEALTIQKELTIGEVSKVLHLKTVYPVIQSLLKKKVISVKEQLIERFKPRSEIFIRLNPDYQSEDKLKSLFDEMEKKARKQLDLLMSYIHLSNLKGYAYQEISRSDLLEKSKSGNAALSALLQKKIFVQEKKEVGRIHDEKTDEDTFILTPSQQSTLQTIKEEFKDKGVVLLHGVTSSGKTNVYIRLIEEVLAAGKQVLYLLPEIALTAQIVERLRRQFGNKIGIYHSKFNQQERVEIWNKLLRGEYQVLLGARSGLFLPYENLGLVIVDEEHDSSYKQHDPAPRYNGRDAAVYLASLFGAKTILGSATPSIESYHHALSHKYGIAALNERFTGIEMPEMMISDVKEEKKKKTMHSHFTSALLDEMKSALSRKEQIILFQNRRGYAPYMQCETCGWVALCPNCDVHLTYHKFQHELRCHYCGHRKTSFSQCPACAGSHLVITGFGTEKIEDELKLLLPETAIGRLDLDSIRAKHGHQKIIGDFDKGKIRVLVGTQMVTKGLDFENVSLVGIMNADQLLNHIDFRSAERGFQLMSQVSGRAGRKNKQGKVIIQTNQPQAPLLQFIINHDYKGFFDEEITHRKRFLYPPFSRLIQLTFKHKEKNKAAAAANLVSDVLRKELGKKLLGPDEPPVSRIKNLFLVQTLIKLERSGQLISHTKDRIKEELQKLEESGVYRSVNVVVDVDPG